MLLTFPYYVFSVVAQLNGAKSVDDGLNLSEREFYLELER